MSDAPLVLHVDDYESARYARTRALQHAGFRVVEAGIRGKTDQFIYKFTKPKN